MAKSSTVTQETSAPPGFLQEGHRKVQEVQEEQTVTRGRLRAFNVLTKKSDKYLKQTVKLFLKRWRHLVAGTEKSWQKVEINMFY